MPLALTSEQSRGIESCGGIGLAQFEGSSLTAVAKRLSVLGCTRSPRVARRMVCLLSPVSFFDITQLPNWPSLKFQTKR
jgi:hypothetical protein